ncbi:DUF2474 family protein [Pseudoroseomonas cervicalis]|nr:DUF2474 family protein [Pseudoroseomonas cervicalis]
MAPPPLWRRLGWFLLLWLAGVASLTAVAGLLRWALKG